MPTNLKLIKAILLNNLMIRISLEKRRRMKNRKREKSFYLCFFEFSLVLFIENQKMSQTIIYLFTVQFAHFRTLAVLDKVPTFKIIASEPLWDEVPTN